MRVLIFTSQFFLLGGAERLAIELAEDLNKHNVSTDLLSMYSEDLPGVAEPTATLLRNGISAVHFLGMRIHPPLSSIVPAILKLRHLIARHNYDIVETSTLSPSAIASWAVLGTRARHVVGLHQVFRRDREKSKRHLLWLLSIKCNHGNRYYAVSNYAAEQWIKYSNTSPQHTKRVYNAIPDDCFTATAERREVRRELGIAEDGHLAVYVGRLAACKGIDTILDALGPVLEQHHLYLLYAGLPDLNVNGTKEILQKMDQRINNEQWHHRVKFLGFRKDVPRLMASADVLVHPTRTEGFGLALVEAMAAGLPIVASNAEGIPEVLAGTSSIMVPPNNPEILREAVLDTLYRSSTEAIKAIERGKKRADDFRMKKRTEAMIQLFREVLEGSF